MNNITEILGSKKAALNVNSDIKTRLILSQPSTLNVESSLFIDINQDEQYVLEKTASNNFRFYGSISPIINKQAYKKNQDNIEPINLDTKILSFDDNNWTMVLLQPNKNNTNKGQKKLTNSYSSVDLTNGLPALPVRPSFKEKGNLFKGLYFYLGHNFKVDDKIYVKSTTDNGYLTTGIYTITSVKGNRVFTNEIYRVTSNIVHNSAYSVSNSNVVVNNPSDIKQLSKGLTVKTVDKNAGKVNITVSDIDFGYFDENNITNFISSRPSSYENINPTLYVRKILDNEILEYYVKTGVVVDVLNQLDDCGFSLSPYGIKKKNFVFNNTFDTTNLIDNLNNPINHVYLGIIKNGSTSENNFSDVEANLTQLIEFTNLNEGYQIINTKSASMNPQKPKIGDEYLISICEYSTENLQETDITHFEHRFIHNDVLFYYKPFNRVDLRLFSTYIETGENVTNIPTYSTYSKKKDNYIWRDLYDVGVANENGDVIDFPFLNNSFYSYTNISFFLNIEKNKTLKYRLNQNDLNNLGDVSNLINEFKSLTDNLNLTNTTEDPFKTYKNIQC